MDNAAKIYLVAPPESVSAAAATGFKVAHMIYRIGRGYHLFRSERARVSNGGLLVVDTGGYTGGGPSSALMAEIIGECRHRNFEGIILDVGNTPAKSLFPMAGELGAEAKKNGLRLYVPEKNGGFQCRSYRAAADRTIGGGRCRSTLLLPLANTASGALRWKLSAFGWTSRCHPQQEPGSSCHPRHLTRW